MRQRVTAGAVDIRPEPTAGAALSGAGAGVQFFRGLVVDCYAYLNMYAIARSHGATIYGTTGGMPVADQFGCRSGTVLSPGTEVLCVLGDRSDYCFIICALPTLQTYPGLLTSDWLMQSSGVTILDKPVHGGALDAPAIKLTNWNTGRPYDSLPGDHALLNPLGMGLHVGLLEAFLRAGDDAGIWLFKQQGLVRQVARRLQLWTPLRDLDAGDDEGELYEYEERCAFPWESLGLRRPGAPLAETPGRTYDPATGIDPDWVEGSHLARFEPREPDQRMAARAIRLGGYLGGLDREVTVVQPSALEVDSAGSGQPPVGLAERFVGLDGAVEIRSRRSVAIEKAAFVAAPRRSLAPDDPAGDTAERGAYPASGHFGDAEKPDRSAMPLGDARLDVAALPDQLAWDRSKLGVGPLKGRLDFQVAPESATEGYGGKSVDDGVHVGGREFRAPEPEYTEVEVDHRDGSTRKLFKSRAGIYFQPDGKVVIEDAWGSQIVMAHGNIYITCAGDVVTATGRSIVQMAPRDVCVRAGNSVDVSAGTGDLRLKAERNLHALAGNSGEGGALIESRGVGFTQDFAGKVGSEVTSAGVVLKAAAGPAAVYGRDVYLRSIDRGDVIIDADGGLGELHEYSNRELHLVRTSTNHLFGATPGGGDPPDAVEYHSAGNVNFGQAGSVVFSASTTLVAGNLAVNRGIVARTAATQSGGQLGQWGAGTGASIATGLGSASEQLASVAQFFTAPAVGDRPYADGGYGGGEVISSIGFSFRTDAQYDVDFAGENDHGLFLPEARWQQGLRRAGQSDTWEEPAVLAPGTTVETMPYPGAANLTEEPLFASVTLLHWTPTEGDAYDPTGYSADAPAPIARTTFERGYIVKYTGE